MMAMTTAMRVSAALAEKLAEDAQQMPAVLDSFRFISDNASFLDSLPPAHPITSPRVALTGFARTENQHLFTTMVLAEKAIRTLSHMTMFEAITNNPDVPASDLPSDLWINPRAVAEAAVSEATGSLRANFDMIMTGPSTEPGGV